MLEPPANTRLAEIAVPTLIVAGTLDMPDALASAETLASDIAGAVMVEIPGTAHLPSMEQPAAFDALVLNFIGERFPAP